MLAHLVPIKRMPETNMFELLRTRHLPGGKIVQTKGGKIVYRGRSLPISPGISRVHLKNTEDYPTYS